MSMDNGVQPSIVISFVQITINLLFWYVRARICQSIMESLGKSMGLKKCCKVLEMIIGKHRDVCEVAKTLRSISLH